MRWASEKKGVLTCLYNNHMWDFGGFWLPPAADGNKYRDLQPDVQRVRDLGTLDAKQDVIIKSFPSRLRESRRRGGRKSVRDGGDGGHWEQGLLNRHDQSSRELTETHAARTGLSESAPGPLYTHGFQFRVSMGFLGMHRSGSLIPMPPLGLLYFCLFLWSNFRLTVFVLSYYILLFSPRILFLLNEREGRG